MSIGTGIEACF